MKIFEKKAFVELRTTNLIQLPKFIIVRIFWAHVRIFWAADKKFHYKLEVDVFFLINSKKLKKRIKFYRKIQKFFSIQNRKKK